MIANTSVNNMCVTNIYEDLEIGWSIIAEDMFV